MKKKYAYYQGREYDPKNPRDARRIIDHPGHANGPLVKAPGADNRRYVGWKRVRTDGPVLDEDGDTIPIEDFEKDERTGGKRHVMTAQQFEWVFDPTPIKVPISFGTAKDIARLNQAVKDGDLVLVAPEEAKKLRGESTPKKPKPKATPDTD